MSEHKYLARKKLQEIIRLIEVEPGGTTGWSGSIDGWEFNIRKKVPGYRIPILPIKEASQ